MIISEKINELEAQIKRWNEAGVSTSLAPWHCGMGHPDKKSRYQQTLEELKYLKGILNDNQ